MQIIHKIEDFLFELFPKAKTAGNDVEILKDELTRYYTFGPYKPTVTIKDEIIEIKIDVSGIINQKADFDKAVALCEKRRFTEAKPVLEKLIQENPTVSEYHRILGQIYSEEGNQDEAIDTLIDALRWDPKNGYALVMMGNILAKQKDDINTACKYFNEAIKHNPKDFIAINNLATNLIQIDKWDEGLKYYEEAYKINPDYPNTSHGLALSNAQLGNISAAFEYSVACMKKCGINDKTLYNHTIQLAVETSKKLAAKDTGRKIFTQYRKLLEEQCGLQIKDEQDGNIETAAKMEFAENYKRDFHLIRFKPGYIAVEHLMMHELVHLDFVTAARKDNTNMLVISGDDKKKMFIRDNDKTIIKLNKEGYSEESVTVYITELFKGINRQVFNVPVDLFIEDFLYENYPELRPYQFLSLYGLISEGIAAVTDKTAINLSPKEILSASKILNIVIALHYKDLYGFDLISKFNASTLESNEAIRLYEEFKDYRNDRKNGEEYELVQHWADDLKLSKYFELVDENEFRNKRTDPAALLKSIEDDPFGLESDVKFRETQMDKFKKSQQSIGTNMAVVMFMVEALQYFKEMPVANIKKIAHEIAMQGALGYSPEKNDYRLSLIPGKIFSGYQILAYYYISFSIAIPDLLAQLKLPFDEEFQMALQIIKGK